MTGVLYNNNMYNTITTGPQRPQGSQSSLQKIISHMIDQSMSDDTFRYLLIPADVSLPIQTLTGSKSGGLGNDELQREAKKYFYERSDKKARQGESSVARID